MEFMKEYFSNIPLGDDLYYVFGVAEVDLGLKDE